MGGEDRGQRESKQCWQRQKDNLNLTITCQKSFPGTEIRKDGQTKWMLVPVLKKCPHGVPEILSLKEEGRQMDSSKI